ncbi:MAG: protein kinase [Chloroflexota bacterium]|nr:protein kinase [Dehalococcoidia bacterium]MDW8253098.1 protein kinase [Chloroflexota bacterium]
MQELRGVQLGPYVLEREIGQVGAARVFVGMQTTLGRRVMVKVLNLSGAVSPTVIERFKREAAAISRLRHPHIVTVHDFGEESGLLYLVTEYVEGGTLAERLGQPLPFIQAYLIISQVASALDYAHSRGVIHRNVSPDTLLLVERGGPRSLLDGNAHPWVLLSDFSLVKLTDLPTVTGNAALFGAPYYMSPEQAQGLPVDKTTDIYSLAIVAFELLTGHVPFGGNTAFEVANKHITEPLPSVRLVVPDLPPEIDRVLQTAAAKYPRERYQSAGDFADAFARAGGIEPTGRDASLITPSVGNGVAPAFPAGEPVDDEDEAPIRPLPSWAIPAGGATIGLLFICLAIFCGLNIVGPAVSRALGLTTTPTPTATPTVRPVLPAATGTVTGTAGTAATPTIPVPTVVVTGAVIFPSDAEAVQNVVRQSNVVWARAVGKGGTTDELSTVFAGRWLNLITSQVRALRSNQQYRDAQLLDLRIESIEFQSNTSATVRTVERWNDTLRAENGTLITTNPSNLRQEYDLERINGRWYVVDSRIQRG